MSTLSAVMKLAFCLVASTAATSVYQTEAETALGGLQTFYDNSTGLWHSFPPSWWQSANALTTLANMVSLNSSYAESVAQFVFPNTFKEAQAFDISHGHNVKRQQTPWTDRYYDDEGWWAMAWIRVYDVTQNATYLNASEGLFQDMTNGWGTNCSSQGLWWNKNHTEINPIANLLFMEVAAYLANRVPSRKQYYVDWAEREWNWFQSSGMFLSSAHLVGGGINLTSCQANPNAKAGYTYAQGTLVQALTELTEATNNKSYVDEAGLVAQAAMKNLTQDGILQDHIDQAHPGKSAPQFKGVFMRGLMRLQQAVFNSSFQQFSAANADSIWKNDRESSSSPQLGPSWLGPFYGPANASQQSSAMDALVAAWSGAD